MNARDTAERHRQKVVVAKSDDLHHHATPFTRAELANLAYAGARPLRLDHQADGSDDAAGHGQQLDLLGAALVAIERELLGGHSSLRPDSTAVVASSPVTAFSISSNCASTLASTNPNADSTRQPPRLMLSSATTVTWSLSHSSCA